MVRKNLALAKNDGSENPSETQALRIERAAEKVSGELDKVIHERMRLGIISSRRRIKSELTTEKHLNTNDCNIIVHARSWKRPVSHMQKSFRTDAAYEYGIKIWREAGPVFDHIAALIRL